MVPALRENERVKMVLLEGLEWKRTFISRTPGTGCPSVGWMITLPSVERMLGAMGPLLAYSGMALGSITSTSPGSSSTKGGFTMLSTSLKTLSLSRSRQSESRSNAEAKLDLGILFVFAVDRHPPHPMILNLAPVLGLLLIIKCGQLPM